MHFENEIEHKILVTYVIAKVSGRLKYGINDIGERISDGLKVWEKRSLRFYLTIDLRWCFFIYSQYFYKYSRPRVLKTFYIPSLSYSYKHKNKKRKKCPRVGEPEASIQGVALINKN